MPGSNSTSTPSTLAIGMPLLRRDFRAGVDARARAILGDAVLHLVAEVPEQALDRTSGRVAEAADGVAFDLAGHVEQEVDLRHLRLAGDHPLHDAPHPA